MPETVIQRTIDIASPMRGKVVPNANTQSHGVTNKSIRRNNHVTFDSSFENRDIATPPKSANDSAALEPLPSSISGRQQHKTTGLDGTALVARPYAANHRLSGQRSTGKSGGATNPTQRRPVQRSIKPLDSTRRNLAVQQSKPSDFPQSKTRLPWLDGSRSRQPSLPPVPGAFFDDNSTPSLAAQERTREKGTTFRAPYLHARAEETPYVRPTTGSRRNSWSESSRSSILSEYSSNPKLEHRMLSPGKAQQIATHVMVEIPVDDSLGQPAVPLIELGREFHLRDSRFAPDVKRTNVESPRRSLSDSSMATDANANVDADTVYFKDENNPTKPGVSLTQHDSHGRRPSLKQPLEIALQNEADQLTSSQKSRRPSLALQTVRSDKVRFLQDDGNADGLVKRKRSLSVQPIKTKPWRRTSSDDETVLNPPKIMVSNSNEYTTADRLHTAVADLEKLMFEAIKLAKEATNHARLEEIPALLEAAKSTLRQSMQTRAEHYEAKTTAVGALHTSGSSSSPVNSPDMDDLHVPALQPSPSGQSDVTVDSQGRISRYSRLGTRSVHTAPVIAAQTQPGVRTIWDEEWPNHRVAAEQSGNEIENSLQMKDMNPTAVDWAYKNIDHGLRDVSQPITSGVKGKAKEFSRSALLPTRPTIDEVSSRRKNTVIVQEYPSQPVLSDYGLQYPTQEQRGSSIPIRNTSLTQPQSPLVIRDSPTDISPDDMRSSTRAVYGLSFDQRKQSSQIPNWGRDKYDEKDFASDDDSLTGKNHITLKEGQFFSLHRGHKHQPIARNWDVMRKRFTATVACINTALVGILIGIYAGEVPAIQYALADQHHRVILGNVVLYLAMGVSVFLFWPLPLLHGRKPYTLVALAFALPLQIPQAVVVSQQQGTQYSGYLFGLLFSRALSGFALGFAHINFKSTLLDLYGASLQSDHPHGELVIVDDIRRHGGGMGLWLGIWSWCFIGSVSFGFLIGADIISGLDVSWGFYISVIMIAVTILLNVLTPETRRAPHRRTMQEVELPNDTISRRVARGEIKMHVYGEGPKWWWEEVWAGIYLSFRMLSQTGFLVMAIYLAWIYAQIVLIIVLLGNLLSAGYRWRPEYVGLGVLSIAIGGLLAIPSSKANIFSRSRVKGPRTDSMTLQPNFTWTSHLVRRALFMIALPIAGLAYTLASGGANVQFMVPIIFAGVIGYISNLAIAECNGLIMETFDTSDLQPGANSRHRLQSLPPSDKQKRTTYSSYPRVSAGFFVSQSLGFLLAAAATGIGGAVTRKVGAQRATGITAGILFGLTLLLTAGLLRYKNIQVIPNELFGHYFGSTNAGSELTRKHSTASMQSDRSWRAVIIGNPSGKVRRMSWLELGSLSRWTEVRRLNRLLNRSTTQALNPGWR